jgi:hypothetical protein
MPPTTSPNPRPGASHRATRDTRTLPWGRPAMGRFAGRGGNPSCVHAVAPTEPFCHGTTRRPGTQVTVFGELYLPRRPWRRRRGSNWNSGQRLGPTRWSPLRLGRPSPAFCDRGQGSRRNWAQWPLPETSQPDSISASASRHQARQAKTGIRDSVLARYVGSTGGGDADPDPTLACSRAAHRGGLDSPLRRLMTIPDGTLVAARHPRRPDHDRRSDQPTERCR